MSKRQIELEIDVSDQSSEMACGVCLSAIQMAADHRQCGHCGMTICVGCISQLQKPRCPTCKQKPNFVVNTFIARHIYPKLITRCTYVRCGREILDLGRHLESCAYRPLPCTFCAIPIDTASIHEHYAACRPWITILPEGLIEAIRALVEQGPLVFHTRPPADSKEEIKRPGGYLVRLSGLWDPAKSSPISPSDRVAYIWRAGPSIYIRCIQLDCAMPDRISLHFSNSKDEGSSYSLPSPVCSADNLHSTAPTDIAVGRLVEYDKCEFKGGAHLLKLGAEYIVRGDDGIWTRAQLAEVQSDAVRTLTFISILGGEVINIPFAKADERRVKDATPGNIRATREIQGTMMMIASLGGLDHLMGLMGDPSSFN